MVMVVGYFLGYLFIARVLLPVYYRNNVISIYEFLGIRLGVSSYKTGSLFFLLSRIVGASARLYIVTMVVQVLICDSLGIPFVLTAVLILVLIALYSATGGDYCNYRYASDSSHVICGDYGIPLCWQRGSYRK
jgi:Na+/proline symporter